MISHTRSRCFGLAAAALGAVALTLGLPSAALADHPSRREDRRGYRHEDSRQHDAHRGRVSHRWQDAHRRHPVRARAPRYARGVHYRQAAYYCQPCSHRFQSRVAFDRHLHHAHRVPFWRIPFVLAHAAFGWIFYG